MLVIPLMFAVLAAASAIDLHERRIPNRLTYPATLAALTAGIATGGGWESAGGLALAGGLMALFCVLSRGQLGVGDVKLSAFIGAALGAPAVPTFLLLATALGAIFAAVMLVVHRDRRMALPYGPWLAAGAALAEILSDPRI